MSDAPSLIEAVEADDPSAIEQLLANRPKLVHAFAERPQPHGEEAWLGLHVAAAKGHYDAAAALLARGAQPDARTRFADPYQARATALHLAAASGSAEILDLLLQYGATLEVRDAHERSPLARAARQGEADAVERLLTAGAMVDPPSATGQTPLHEAIGSPYATREAVERVVELLIDAGAAVNARCRRDPVAYTPLHRCVLMGTSRTAVMRALLAAGADPTLADPAHGRTPLMLAECYQPHHLASLQPMIDLLRKPPTVTGADDQPESRSQSPSG